MKIYLEINTFCTKCDNCRLICPENSILLYNNEFFIEESSCSLCGLCVEVCPVNAIKFIEDFDEH